MTNTQLMREAHREAPPGMPRNAAGATSARPGDPWEWALTPGEVRRIESAPVIRWLDVAAGRVWLTPTRDDDLADDHWLSAGERLALPAGSAWVLEAWPSARVALHQAPPCGLLC